MRVCCIDVSPRPTFTGLLRKTPDKRRFAFGFRPRVGLYDTMTQVCRAHARDPNTESMLEPVGGRRLRGVTGSAADNRQCAANPGSPFRAEEQEPLPPSGSSSAQAVCL